MEREETPALPRVPEQITFIGNVKLYGGMRTENRGGLNYGMNGGIDPSVRGYIADCVFVR